MDQEKRARQLWAVRQAVLERRQGIKKATPQRGIFPEEEIESPAQREMQKQKIDQETRAKHMGAIRRMVLERRQGIKKDNRVATIQDPPKVLALSPKCESATESEADERNINHDEKLEATIEDETQETSMNNLSCHLSDLPEYSEEYNKKMLELLTKAVDPKKIEQEKKERKVFLSMANKIDMEYLVRFATVIFICSFLFLHGRLQLWRVLVACLVFSVIGGFCMITNTKTTNEIREVKEELASRWHIFLEAVMIVMTVFLFRASIYKPCHPNCKWCQEQEQSEKNDVSWRY